MDVLDLNDPALDSSYRDVRTEFARLFEKVQLLYCKYHEKYVPVTHITNDKAEELINKLGEE